MRDNNRLENRTLIIKTKYNLVIGKQNTDLSRQKHVGLNPSPVTFVTPSVTYYLVCIITWGILIILQ